MRPGSQISSNYNSFRANPGHENKNEPGSAGALREREVASEHLNMLKSSPAGMGGRQMSANVLHRRAPTANQSLQQTFNENMKKARLNASQKKSEKTLRTHYTSTVHKFSLLTERKS